MSIRFIPTLSTRSLTLPPNSRILLRNPRTLSSESERKTCQIVRHDVNNVRRPRRGRADRDEQEDQVCPSRVFQRTAHRSRFPLAPGAKGLAPSFTPSPRTQNGPRGCERDDRLLKTARSSSALLFANALPGIYSGAASHFERSSAISIRIATVPLVRLSLINSPRAH